MKVKAETEKSERCSLLMCSESNYQSLVFVHRAYIFSSEFTASLSAAREHLMSHMPCWN